RSIPALRFAYRVRIDTDSSRPGHGSYMLWIDAGTGDLLKSAPESAEATPVTMYPWCRDPATAPSMSGCSMQFNIDGPGNYSNGDFSLVAQGLTVPNDLDKMFPMSFSP